MWMYLAAVETRISNGASLAHSRPSRPTSRCTRTRKVSTRRSAFATWCVALISSHSHSIYVSTNRTMAGRKRGNDAGRAKANPPPFNAATIILQTPLPANLPSFYLLSPRSCNIALSSSLHRPPSALPGPGTATRPASHSLSHLLSNNAPHANRRIILLGATPL